MKCLHLSLDFQSNFEMLFLFPPPLCSPLWTFRLTQNYDLNLQTETSWPKAWVWTRYRNGLSTTLIRIVQNEDRCSSWCSNPFWKPTASVLVAACKWWHICHDMHREHTSRSARLLQISFTLDLTLHFSLCVNLILPPYPWTASLLQQCHPQMRGSRHLYSEPWHIVQCTMKKHLRATCKTRYWMVDGPPTGKPVSGGKVTASPPRLQR